MKVKQNQNSNEFDQIRPSLQHSHTHSHILYTHSK